MNLLFTGASGFLGRNIQPILSKLYNTTTLGLTDYDNIKVDITRHIPVLEQNYEIVLHAAGMAHFVPKNEEEAKIFFNVNYQGTINLCRALEQSSIPRAFIFISTVAVYGLDIGENITEESPLNGTTPYALSKIKAEEFLTMWCQKNEVTLSIVRPSLIAGPNATGNLGAMVNGIKTGRYLRIGDGKARKSVLMVHDIANLIPVLAEKGGIFNLCDEHQPTFLELESLISRQLGKKKPYCIPYWFAKILAFFGDFLGDKAPINSLKLKKITKSLTFSNKKAKRELGWEPLNVLENYKIF